MTALTVACTCTVTGIVLALAGVTAVQTVVDVHTTDVRANDEFTDHRWVTLDDGPWDEAPLNVRQLAVVALAAGRA